MRFGPDRFVSCPKCEGWAKCWTLMSGNMIGARRWTDGKVVAPMMQCLPEVVKCRHCGECYWLIRPREEAEEEEAWRKFELDEQSMEDKEEHERRFEAFLKAISDPNLEYVKEPTEEEYYLAIEKGLAENPKEEKRLRILAWQRRNDAFRYNLQVPIGGTPSAPGPWRNNLEVLVNLLQEDDENDRLLKAEALRELGEFESAKRLLDPLSLRSDNLGEVARRIHSLCESGDTYVRDLRFDRVVADDQRREPVVDQSAGRDMGQPGRLTERQKNVIFGLQALLLLSVASYWFLPRLDVSYPGWLGALIALACLMGMLLVFRRAAALRGWFILAFIGVLMVTSVLAWLVAHA